MCQYDLMFYQGIRSLCPIFYGIVILPNFRYTVGYLNKVFCSHESLGLDEQAKHKNRSP